MGVIADRIYLDAASVEPRRPVAREAFHAALDDGWADPLRLHSEARRARALCVGARGTDVQIEVSPAGGVSADALAALEAVVADVRAQIHAVRS